MKKAAKTIDDVRRILAEAIASSPFTAASLSRKLGRGKDYLRDFLAPNKQTKEYRKNSLSAEERDALARLLKLERDHLAIGIAKMTSSPVPQKPIDTLFLIEESLRAAVSLGCRQWTDDEFQLVAEKVQEYFLEFHSSAEDVDTRRMRLELHIRRALQKESR
jgi:hypothetical protein